MCHRGLTASVSPKLLRIAEERFISYRDIQGGKSPGLIFLPGFMSNMNGMKANALEEFACKNGHPFVKFDYEGTGESPGEFKQQTLSRWKENIKIILNILTTGPQILIGSSMGGWLMCLIALEFPEKIHGLVGICPAINFIRDLQLKMDDKSIQKEDDGSVRLKGPYGHYIFHKKLLDDSENHILSDNSKIPIQCPVRLIHGMKDDVIHYEKSIKLMENVLSKDVRLILCKNGDHRMSEPREIEILIQTVKSLCD